MRKSPCESSPRAASRGASTVSRPASNAWAAPWERDSPALVPEGMEGALDRGLELGQDEGLVIGGSAGESASDVAPGLFQQPGDLGGGRSLDARERAGRAGCVPL